MTPPLTGDYACFSMKMRGFRAAALLVCLSWATVRPAAADGDEPTLFRLFLKDGRTLVSYGEPARVDDRVVFSMPTGAPGPTVPLRLVNIASDEVDWAHTARYAEAARAAQYISTRGEDDYAELSDQVARALNDVTVVPEPEKRLQIAESARQRLADWPSQHFGYRQSDVRQMLSMLDEVIADLRVAAGAERFQLNFVAFPEGPLLEPLMPPPGPKDVIEQTLYAARLVSSPAERLALLEAATQAITREAASLPKDWADARRAEAAAAVDRELRIERSYQALTRGILAVVERHLKSGNVTGIERALDDIDRQDEALGHKRPESVDGLVAAVQEKLDAARRYQAAREHWATRSAVLSKYRATMAQPLEQLASLAQPLDDIKALAGTSPQSLARIEQACDRVLKTAGAVAAPEEVAAPHAMLVSAAHLAVSAARIRREAILAGDLSRAWNASSAAAGALMLSARAMDDLQAATRPPALP